VSIGVEKDIVGQEEREWQEKQEEEQDKKGKELGEKGKATKWEPRWQGIEEGEEVVRSTSVHWCVCVYTTTLLKTIFYNNSLLKFTFKIYLSLTFL
tara:strand:+ start:83 stop:370 length:288 start_codon:yes stop_codon:yes gene_type:complete